ncbi:MAG: sulfite exporter TauE/SafE family protein, partial [Pseudomonadota bacterium]
TCRIGQNDRHADIGFDMEAVAWLQPEGMAFWAAGVLVVSSGLTSFIAGAFGLGGGIVLLAIMGSLMPVTTMIPVHGVVQLGSNAGRALMMLKNISTGILLPFLMGSLIGGAVGGLVVIRMPPELLQIGLGVFVLWSIWGRLPALASGRWAMAITGLISTFLTMFFGATGVFVASMVRTLGFDRLTFVASHAACMTLQHGIKVIAFGLLGFAFGDYAPLMLAMIASGVLGTYIGRLVLKRTPDERFQLILNGLLTIMALRLLWQGASAFL